MEKDSYWGMDTLRWLLRPTWKKLWRKITYNSLVGNLAWSNPILNTRPLLPLAVLLQIGTLLDPNPNPHNKTSQPRVNLHLLGWCLSISVFQSIPFCCPFLFSFLILLALFLYSYLSLL